MLDKMSDYYLIMVIKHESSNLKIQWQSVICTHLKNLCLVFRNRWKFDIVAAFTYFPGDSKNSYVVGKEYAPIVDITWPPSNPRAIHSGLRVSGEILEKLNPFLESGKVKALIDPNGPYHLGDVIKAFEYLETGRAKGKVVIFPFYPGNLTSAAWNLSFCRK